MEIIQINAFAPMTEYSCEFLQGMINRMGVSYHKYGKVADAYPHNFNAIDSMKERVLSYQATGNTEYLMDAANFLMIEFMHPSHEKAHFIPTDSDGSPGRTTVHGIVTHEANNAVRDRLYKRDGD